MSRILYRYLVVKFLLLALLLMQAPSALQAQEAGGGGGGGEDLFANSMQDMMIVTGAGV
ncbi:MAG: hypothetical protein HN730_03800, partial [Bdellovibrionales bacterium]|nr:hypothetical protein [Bdellovibrionales bacterium]